MSLPFLNLTAGCKVKPILRCQKQPRTRPLVLNLVGKLQNTERLEGFAVLHVHKHHIRMIRLEEDEVRHISDVLERLLGKLQLVLRQ